MEQKTDLRIIKTYKALTDAFWQMLSEKKLEDITVNELCDRAMVRRATFYKHFGDKYDFFAFVIRMKQEQFDAQIRPHIDKSQPQSFYIGIVKHTLDFLNSNKKLVQTILESDMLPTIMDILSEQISLDITRKLKADAQNGIPLPASPQVMAQFFTGALVYTSKWWVAQKKVSQAELLEELTCLLNGF
ncbi:MAG: TetR/AcrR family transcriptional regulator [Thermoflexales bacterium]|nr:TetR/AcrR family transcriptional regulator [Thermoflexales bacterium]